MIFNELEQGQWYADSNKLTVRLYYTKYKDEESAKFTVFEYHSDAKILKINELGVARYSGDDDLDEALIYDYQKLLKGIFEAKTIEGRL